MKTSKILCIPNKIKVFPVENDYGSRFVFVGSADYGPNRKAIQFLIDVMQDPKLSLMKLHIYGNAVENSKFHNIVYHPWATDGELYGKSDIHLVPIMHGAGMKYKTLVPLSLNLRVISTIEGAVGIREDSKLWIVEDLRQFHEALLTIVSDVAEISENPSTSSPSLSFFDQTSSLINILDGLRT